MVGETVIPFPVGGTRGNIYHTRDGNLVTLFQGDDLQRGPFPEKTPGVVKCPRRVLAAAGGRTFGTWPFLSGMNWGRVGRTIAGTETSGARGEMSVSC